MSDLGLDKCYQVVSEPTENIFLQCGMIKGLKKLDDNVGKIVEIGEKSCIITYPLHFLVSKGQGYLRKFTYTIEVIKNVLMEKQRIEYFEGKIRCCNTRA